MLSELSTPKNTELFALLEAVDEELAAEEVETAIVLDEAI